MSDLKIQGEVSLDTSNADSAFARVEANAGKMARGVSQQADKAGQSVKGIGDGADQSAQKLDRGTRSIIASVQRTTAAMEAGERGTSRYFETLARQRGANLDVLRPYLSQLDEAQRKQDAAARSLANVGVSAAQTAAALRGVPAQFTDIAVSLSSGQAPLTVLLQQGGQLKDMFGGIGPAARALGGYVVGLVNPFTIAAAAAGGLAYALFSAEQASTSFQRATLMNGNAIGTTADELREMSKQVAAVIGNQSQANEVVASLAQTGKVSREVLVQAAIAVAEVSRTGAMSAEEMVKQLSELGKSPVDALKRLNEQYNFVNAATFDRIRSLKEEGREEEAAALAQRTYAEQFRIRGKEVIKTAGEMEGAWLSLKNVVKDTWDSMFGASGGDTVAMQAAKLRSAALANRAAAARNDENAKGAGAFGGDYAARSKQLLAQAAQQEAEADRIEQAAKKRLTDANASAARSIIERQAYEAKQSLEAQRAALANGTEKMEAELKKYRNNLEKIRAATPDSPLLDAKQIAQDEARIREQFKDKGAERLAKRDANEAKQALEAYRDLITDLSGKQDGFSSSFNDQVKTLYNGWKLSGDSIEVYNRAFDQLLRQQPFFVEQERQKAEAQKEFMRLRNEAYNDVARQYEQEVKASLQSAQSVKERVQAMQDEESALVRARLLNISLAEALQQVRIARLESARADAIANGDQEKVDAINAEIAARKELAKLTEQKQARDDVDSLIKRTMQTSIGTDFAAGFDKASQSLGVFVQQFNKLVDLQSDYSKMQGETSLTEAERAAALTRNSRQQAGAYASLTAAAKGFFGEHTAGYKALTTAEQVLRATELAGSLGRIAQIGAEASAAAVLGVINQAKGDPYSAIPRMAAMAAIMAGLGYAVSGGIGASGSFAATNTGTGTVLGDSSAQSASISKSIDALSDIDTLTMRYSAQMAESLRSIENNIGGLAALLVQSGSLSASAAGVQTGFKRDGLGNAIASGYDITSAVLGSIPVIGDLLGGLNGAVGRLVSGLFGTKTSIKGQGIFAADQSLASILGDGFDASYYADIEKKRKVFGITTSKRLSTVYSEADAQLEDQVTKIFDSFSKSILAASGPLGLSLDDVEAKLSSFVVKIGRIDLKGLTGEQIQERLTAVFSAAGDSIAAAAVGGLTAFQKVGEGYFETVVRVASGLEEARSALIRIGVAAIDYTKIADKQGDVGAELARDSILAAEGLTGIADIISAINGSSSEITGAYQSLTDVRLSLKLLGLDAGAVSVSLLQGAGGLQSLVDAVAAFEGGFLSEAEQVSISAAKLSKQFSNLGFSLPTSSAGFVSLVKGIDTSTDAGKQLLGQVLSLSGAFGDLLESFKDVGSGIEDEVNRIRGLSASGGSQSFAELQASFAIGTAKARAGDQAAIDALPDLSKALLKAAEAQAQSSVDVALIQAKTLASLEETLKVVRNPASYLPGFASGGSFGGGWRVVGENGPELEATGPARIYDASETARILGGGDSGSAAEIRALRAELSAYREEQRIGMAVVAANTGKTARTLDNVTTDGTALNTVSV